MAGIIEHDLGAIAMPKPPAESPLSSLAEQINAAHHECETALRQSLEHALRAGRLLTEAKALVKHGGWQAWLKSNFAGSGRTAQLYMQLAKAWPQIEAKAQSVALLTMNEALELAAHGDESELQRAERLSAKWDRENAEISAELAKVAERLTEIDELAATQPKAAVKAAVALAKEAGQLQRRAAIIHLESSREAGRIFNEAQEAGHYETLMHIMAHPETPLDELQAMLDRDRRKMARRNSKTKP